MINFCKDGYKLYVLFYLYRQKINILISILGICLLALMGNAYWDYSEYKMATQSLQNTLQVEKIAAKIKNSQSEVNFWQNNQENLKGKFTVWHIFFMAFSTLPSEMKLILISAGDNGIEIKGEGLDNKNIQQYAAKLKAVIRDWEFSEKVENIENSTRPRFIIRLERKTPVKADSSSVEE